jgi:hypothetical protein
MTLHSVAAAYPDSPTSSERDLMFTFLDVFRDTITCPHCKDHFTTVLENYRKQFPGMLQSRHEFIVFTFRAHNAVNRSLNKPLQLTVEECLKTLQNNVKTRSARDYRIAYYNHITRYWSMMRDVTGIVASKKIREMRKIEAEYISSRDTNFQLHLRSDVTVLPRDVLDKDPQELQTNPFVLPRGEARAGFRITSKGIRLR